MEEDSRKCSTCQHAKAEGFQMFCRLNFEYRLMYDCCEEWLDFEAKTVRD